MSHLLTILLAAVLASSAATAAEDGGRFFGPSPAGPTAEQTAASEAKIRAAREQKAAHIAIAVQFEKFKVATREYMPIYLNTHGGFTGPADLTLNELNAAIAKYAETVVLPRAEELAIAPMNQSQSDMGHGTLNGELLAKYHRRIRDSALYRD